MGSGTSSTVYEAQEVSNPEKKLAIKIIKDSFLKEEESMKTVVNEISVLKQLKHDNINNLLSFGTNGEMTSQDGKTEYN